MLLRHSGPFMSGQLVWSKEGAANSLLLSPVNTKENCSVPLVEVLVLLPPLMEGRNKVQGTGISFPAVEVLLVLPVVAEVPLVEAELLVPEEADSDKEMMAKSTLPDAGLRMTSLMVPSESPDELLTSAPISLLARSSCWPIRPVGLRPD